MTKFSEIYDYREMIFSLVRRDLKGRYKGSVLGFLWTFLNPLLQLCVYTFVFSIIMRNNIKDYYLHLFVALVPWIFFSMHLVSTGYGKENIFPARSSSNCIRKQSICQYVLQFFSCICGSPYFRKRY